MFGSAPDLLRLLVIPLFAWAAVRDVRTRRIPNRVWPPVYLFGLVLLAWETAMRWPLVGIDGRLFLLRVAISLLFVAPLGYAFWYLGGFGGADAKALIGLAIVFPTFPIYYLPISWLPALPAVQTHVGVFSLTILTNTVLVGVLYPVGLGLYNAVRGHRSRVMFLAKPVPVERLRMLHGRLFQTREGYTRRGLDLDALRMYLRWRGLTLADLQAEPDRLRDPGSVDATFDPTDGAAHLDPATDGGDSLGQVDAADTSDGEAPDSDVPDGEAPDSDVPADPSISDVPMDDPWAAERFLSEIEGTAYGTDAEMLREGLETVASTEEVWISPGMPFLVPMFIGLIVALTYGDVLFAVLSAVGWA